MQYVTSAPEIFTRWWMWLNTVNSLGIITKQMKVSSLTFAWVLFMNFQYLSIEITSVSEILRNLIQQKVSCFITCRLFLVTHVAVFIHHLHCILDKCNLFILYLCIQICTVCLTYRNIHHTHYVLCSKPITSGINVTA